MQSAQEIILRAAADDTRIITGSFLVDRRLMTVRHHLSGCSRSISLDNSAANPETVARLVLLEIDDEYLGFAVANAGRPAGRS